MTAAWLSNAEPRRIEVDWPDGRRETFDGGQVDVVRVLQAGEGES